MIFTIIQVLVIQLLLPIWVIHSLWKSDVKSKMEWITLILSSAMLVIWLVLSGRWDWVSYYLRYLLPVLFLLSIYISWKKVRKRNFDKTREKKTRLSIAVNTFLILVFGLYNVFSISGYNTSATSVELSFPLENGVYYVGHGGSSTMMNYHHAYEPQQYALDITKLNSFGTRAAGLYPKSLEKYEIYEDPLYSPCTGKVVEARDGLPDLIPPETHPNQPEGNYVAITCGDDITIYIAHMLKDSVNVEVGDTVTQGEILGLVGNSGNTTEPHLHIHAEKNGVGIPIRFDGDFLTRNELVW